MKKVGHKNLWIKAFCLALLLFNLHSGPGMGRGYIHFTMKKQAQRGQVGRPGFKSCQFDSKAVYLSRILGEEKKKEVNMIITRTTASY